MKRSLILALTGLVLVAPRALAAAPGEVTATGLVLVAPRALAAAPGEVTAVSVLPGPGRAQVVIDVRGSVSVQDFTLRNPARLVIDVLGAQLSAADAVYDGQNRGGILNVRYAQFRPDVVRIVLELESLKDYELEYEGETIRISLGTDRSFTAWSSLAPGAYEVAASAERVFTPELATTAEVPLVQGSQQPIVTASYDSSSIADVMSGFATLSGKTIILGREVMGLHVTAQVTNQPWDVAFEAILESQGLSAVEDPPGIIRVDSRARMFAQDSLARALEPLETRIVRVNYARATALQPILDAVVVPERGSVAADTGTNSLVITDIQSRMDDHVALVRQLDRQTPQVSIQAKLIFVNRTDVEELGVRYDLGSSTQFFNQLVRRRDPTSAEPVDTDGDGVPDQLSPTEFFDPQETPSIIDLGGNSLAAIANADAEIVNPALQLIFSTAIGNFSLTSFVDALQRVELADLQAEPLTSTADNTEAYVLVGERTPIRVLEPQAQQREATVNVDYAQTGILLRVTPHVTNNRQVLMDVRAENSSIQAAPSDVGFTFQTQEAESQVLVDDGQTAVIGGLTVTEVTVSKSGIPFLVDLPIIGGLFGFTQRREQRRDLLILVTPHIIDNPTAVSDSP